MDINASVDVGKNVKELLEKLAAQLGVTIDKVWPWLVKQQIISGWSRIIIWMIFTAIFSVSLKIFARKEKQTDDYFFAMVVDATLLICCVAIGLLGGSTAIAQILNPEYAALKDLMSMVGK